MPKAVSKYKHGRRASLAATDGTRPEGTSSRAHHAQSKHSASSRAEKRTDKVLKKLCERASNHVQAPAVPPPASPMENVAFHGSDQLCDCLSLIEGNMVTWADSLWGHPLQPATRAPSLAAPANQPPPAAPGSDPGPEQPTVPLPMAPPTVLLSQEQLQQIIASLHQPLAQGPSPREESSVPF